MADQTTPIKPPIPPMPTPRTVYITVGADPGATTTVDGTVVESLIAGMEMADSKQMVCHLGKALRIALGLPRA